MPILPRWRVFLAPVLFSSLLTALLTINIMAPNDLARSVSETALDSVMGSGAPLLAGDDRLPRFRGGGSETDEEEPDAGQPRETEILADDGEEHGIDVDDDDANPRPKKRPKGKRWRGWLKSLPMDMSNNEWWRNSRQCFEVDAICHQRHENEWFYYTPSKPQGTNRSAVFQPTMELKCAPAKYDGKSDRGEPRISIKVTSSSKLRRDEIKHCYASSTPTHIVLQSLFNDMIGEFYSRTVLKLYRFMSEGAAWKDGKDVSGKFPWEEDVQFYVHIPYGNKKMLDGHRLLLSGMLSNPDSPAAKSLIELFVQKEAADRSGSADCQCYERMVFCGYDVYTHSTDVKSEDVELAKDDDDGIGKADISQSVGVSNIDDHELKYTLWSAGKLAGFDSEYRSCGRNTRGAEYECREWNQLRYFLSKNFVKHYPMLEMDIMHRRRQQLVEQGLIDESYRGDTREFTVVGLTQRTYRRSWLNLPSVLDECNAAPFERLLCVEINVENASTPFEQLLIHRSLDVMLGVHGAQLTQAILLPQHAHILEILPWVPDYIRGKWVQTTHLPTPLGVIFHNTDLNHAGYSLDRSSVPLCEDVDESEERTCFMRQRKKFIWENRNFNLASKAVLDYIKNVVLFGREKKRTCKEVKENLPQNFVLYNIWCFKANCWHLGLSNGEEACVYGTGYLDDMDEATKGSLLFDTKDKCCAAFPKACLTESESKEENGKSSQGEMVLFHDYRKISSRDEAVSRAEVAALQKVKDMEKKKRQARRKEQKARNDNNRNDGRSSVENKVVPLHSNRKGSSQEVTNVVAISVESEQEKKERRARRKMRNKGVKK